ncbi:putative HTH-type transcriptional regulator YfiR [Candidatus Nitrosocosmicus oleophilus]|jgi:AcrR family transcriptional regulator|uniref:Putative HTH-type transcriptional regulator YfiR n=1 Tax=Candidatus Nitrosocosmicus oleophilus TaxID=1353260 RepID=A0A654LYU0_9ARCH|nr:TetR/AcrR family transcriptional regulator [Candidatus Nitrosocosmicus oleophilus]ALI35606.1 putative HTH-type transcriptional regulator YfiR [Candidatus Nitrosocosmicus oleophilus]
MCPKVTSQHKQEVRGRIIQSAIECFSKNGFDRTRMDEISLLADLSKGTLYNYFDNKEDLFNAICEDSLDLLKIQLDQLFTKSRDDLISNAELFYENFQKIQKEGSAKVFFEALSESTRNPKLKIILFKHRLKIYKVVENYLQIQSDKGFIKGDINLTYVASGMVSLFDGITAGSLLGIPEEYNKNIWAVTIKTILSNLN